MTREVDRIVQGQPTSDGAGVKLWRSIGTRELDHVDPFLLLDEFRSDRPGDYLAGFPDHPHRGFETVTYMLAGAMRHEDHRGNRGDLRAGSVQWMTAGRGIIHSEMPRQEAGLLWGFQLWINLPARDKLCAPRYQDFAPEAIPEARLDDGGVVRVIAGESRGVAGVVQGIATHPLYLDVKLPPEGRFDQPVGPAHTALGYVFEGEARLGGAARAVGRGQLALFGAGDAVAVAAGPAGARLLLLAAEPLGEPIARHGPFVMNTREELQQAFRELQQGTFLG